ncbi:hypothetical protein BHM03_00045688 [Ensete ventricosum]|uniref:Uncharacterized protein n=1 Tax=Ensete ventricosum TaxID=4639 RepID=A0A426YN82_ENSVE|nr:hypothetical protein B296_00045313 [Ensete ventricosum]RZS14036.1 hypothetical protein BHM03_00045688 [Ensete ventricosum]
MIRIHLRRENRAPAKPIPELTPGKLAQELIRRLRGPLHRETRREGYDTSNCKEGSPRGKTQAWEEGFVTINSLGILSRYLWKHNIDGYALLKFVKYFKTIGNSVLLQSHQEDLRV